MNNKGFTLIELLATIIVLSIIAGIAFGIINADFGKAKESVEEVFVDTIRDALNVYLDSDAKSLTFTNVCSNKISKKIGEATVESAVVTMDDVINSSFHPISKSDLVNPAYEEVNCNEPANINITIYRDSDYVYYYSVSKSSFNCLKNIGGDYDEVISNLPEGYSCS